MSEQESSATESPTGQERLWNEYGVAYRRFDDLETLLRDGAVGDEIEEVAVWSSMGPISFNAPENFRFYCPSRECLAQMKFHLSPGRTRTVDPRIPLKNDSSSAHALTYYCLHCGGVKGFLVYAQYGYQNRVRRIVKGGEWPPSGAPLPAAVLDMVDDAKGLLIKGYRCELQGQGIGAVAYYRRVVELRHKDILKAIRKVATVSGAEPETVQSLDAALKNHRFSESVRTTNIMVPRELFVLGKNPLLILHDLLSIDLHDQSEKDCLVDAANLREVLIELANRISYSLQNAQTIGDTLTSAEKRIAETRAAAKAARDAEAGGVESVHLGYRPPQDPSMKLPPDPRDDRLTRISLHGMTIEDALRRVLQAPVEPRPPRKPGAGRKKKAVPES